MFAETLSNEEVESLASTLEWDFPCISEKQKFVEGDVTTLDVIGREFPLLDREAELDLVNPVTEAKNWEVSSFNCWDSLIVLTISASSLIVGGDWDEVSELLRSF